MEAVEKNGKGASASRSSIKCGYAAVPCIALGLLLAMGSAAAQWRVVDREANEKLERANDRLRDANEELDTISRRIGNTSASGDGEGSVTGNLRDLYRQQYIAGYDSSDSDVAAAQEPEVSLDAERPSAAVAIRVEDRCPQPAAGGVAQQQWQLCREIATTELAQYTYSLRMFELTRQRQRYLDQLKEQRADIREHEIGKLEDNTNRILLLMSQMEIDRQQQRYYMDAYAARINYLQQASRTMAQQALEGTRAGSGGLPGLGAIVGGAALAGALDAARTERRSSGFFRRR
ncbi:hypothetical protein [Luteimonas huabeiensis]|uniref:hypothetical protein n=1 Tax=Luteimonas huabeiensis TaxID=1244513 RepID=UPI0012682FAA|nr:hypothetical protein [Luteimonas huabeiensis]